MHREDGDDQDLPSILPELRGARLQDAPFSDLRDKGFLTLGAGDLPDVSEVRSGNGCDLKAR